MLDKYPNTYDDVRSPSLKNRQIATRILLVQTLLVVSMSIYLHPHRIAGDAPTILSKGIPGL